MTNMDFAKLYEAICEFDRHLGLQLSVLEPGNIGYRLTVGTHHLSMPGACHGGVIAAMMDAILGLTALSKVFPQGQMCQTVEFKLNYLTAAKPGDELEGKGWIDFSGARWLVTSATIENLSSGAPIAKGMGTFALYPLTKKAELVELLAAARGTTLQSAPGGIG
ncbi:MAG: PaaI family thioesterase [Gammaproteobacteria bacterium]